MKFCEKPFNMSDTVGSIVKTFLKEEEKGALTIYVDNTTYNALYSDGKLDGDLFGERRDELTGCPYVSPFDDIQDYKIMQHLILVGCRNWNEHIIITKED